MQIITPSGITVEGDPTLAAIKVSPRRTQASGAYAVSARTGLVAAPAAGAGLWIFQWIHPTAIAVIDTLRVRGLLTTPPTTAQEWGIDAIIWRRQTGYPATGTGLSAGQVGGFKKFSQQSNSKAINPSVFFITVAATAAIGTGTALADSSEFASDIAWELAAGAAVPRSRISIDQDFTGGSSTPIQLREAEAIVVRVMPDTIGAAGVLRASIDMEWHEAEPSEL